MSLCPRTEKCKCLPKRFIWQTVPRWLWSVHHFGFGQATKTKKMVVMGKRCSTILPVLLFMKTHTTTWQTFQKSRKRARDTYTVGGKTCEKNKTLADMWGLLHVFKCMWACVDGYWAAEGGWVGGCGEEGRSHWCVTAHTLLLDWLTFHPPPASFFPHNSRFSSWNNALISLLCCEQQGEQETVNVVKRVSFSFNTKQNKKDKSIHTKIVTKFNLGWLVIMTVWWRKTIEW